MITRTYINKFNTIIKNSHLNTGLNPVSELVYGTTISRLLIKFDVCNIKKEIDNKNFVDKSKLKHILKITNAGSIDFRQLHCTEINDFSDSVKKRASSFTLIFFLIPKDWDSGKGFDYSMTYTNQGYYKKYCKENPNENPRYISTDGANWFNAQNGLKWDEEGIFSNDFLSKEYEKFSNNEPSVIIGRQHFDIGNEDISLDITETVNKFVNDEIPNYGIGIAFTPELENTECECDNYIGFLTNKTNTFYAPYVETIYDNVISDDRGNFYLDKNNKLYLYCNIGNSLENLDVIPNCSVNGIEYEVKQHSKGIYYIDINLSRANFKPNTMMYDVWSNIIYNGIKLDDIELDFTLKDNLLFFNISDKIIDNKKLLPTVYGINYDERIKRGDIRKLVINSKIKYKLNSYEINDNVELRLYIKDGTREVDVFPFMKVNKTFLENYIMIDTNILIPQKYFVDIRYNYNGEVIIHHNILSFMIVDDLNNKY